MNIKNKETLTRKYLIFSKINTGFLSYNLILLTFIVHLFPFSAQAQPLTVEIQTNPLLPTPNKDFEISIVTVGVGLSFRLRFDSDDASVPTKFQKSPTFKRKFPRYGHFKFTAEILDSSDNITFFSGVLNLLDVSNNPPPPTSSTISFTPLGEQLWVVHPDNDTVSLVKKNSVEKEVALPTDCHPTTLAVVNDDSIWVACSNLDSIIKVNTAGNIVRTVPLGYGAGPYGVVYHADRKSIFVSLRSKGRVAEVNSDSGQITSSIAVGPEPYALALNPDGNRLLVTRFISAINHGEIYDLKITNSAVSLAGKIKLNETIGTLDTETSGNGVPNYLASVVIDPAGKRAYVSANKVNVRRGNLQGSSSLNFVNTVRAIIAEIDLSTGKEIISRRRDLDNAESPSALAVAPQGDYLLNTHQGSGLFSISDLLDPGSVTSQGAFVLGRFRVGSSPQGIAFHPITKDIAIQNFMSRSVHFFKGSDVILKGDILENPTELKTSQKEKLTPTVLKGKELFYQSDNEHVPGQPSRMSAEGYMACATCHINGSHDGRTWDFSDRGEGARNTTDLRGKRGTGHGDVHWTGNFDEIQDFENDIRNHFGGSGLMTVADFQATFNPLEVKKAGKNTDLDALAAYVATLDNRFLPKSPYRDATGSLTQDAQNGKELFVQKNCQSCHGGKDFTENSGKGSKRRNIGTISEASGFRIGGNLDGIDTPSLLGLWSSPPYLHDGSAYNIKQVFERIAGKTISLTTTNLQNAVLESRVENSGAYSSKVITTQANAQISLPTFNVEKAGPGAITIRYASSTPSIATINVNGVKATSTNLNSVLAPDFTPPPYTWLETTVDINLKAGKNSLTIQITGTVIIDRIALADSDYLPLAQPHRSALALSPEELNQLTTFLLSLDGSFDEGVQNAPPSTTPPTSTPTPLPVAPTPTATVPSSATPPANGEKLRVLFTARAWGRSGKEVLRFLIDQREVARWTMSKKSWKNFSYLAKYEENKGNLRVEFTNDSGKNQSVKLDYLKIGTQTRQAEKMPINTAGRNSSNGTCGQGNTELMVCSGYIDFGNFDAADILSLKTTISFQLRAKSKLGQEEVRLLIGDEEEVRWIIKNTKWKYFTHTTQKKLEKNIKIEFLNQKGEGEVEIDYIKINKEKRQAEKYPVISSDSSSSDKCGKGYSQKMISSCSIDFGFYELKTAINASDITAQWDKSKKNIKIQANHKGLTQCEFFIFDVLKENTNQIALANNKTTQMTSFKQSGQNITKKNIGEYSVLPENLKENISLLVAYSCDQVQGHVSIVVSNLSSK
jgi:hypothetical protein